MNRKCLVICLFMLLAISMAGCQKTAHDFDAWLQNMSGTPFGVNEQGKKDWLGSNLAAQSTDQSLTWLEHQFETADTSPVKNGVWTFFGKKAEVDDHNNVRRVAVLIYKDGKEEIIKALAAIREGENDWRPDQIDQTEAKKMIAVVQMMR